MSVTLNTIRNDLTILEVKLTAKNVRIFISRGEENPSTFICYEYPSEEHPKDTLKDLRVQMKVDATYKFEIVNDNLRIKENKKEKRFVLIKEFI